MTTTNVENITNVSETLDKLERFMSTEFSPYYSIGYLKQTLTTLILSLPPEKRKFELDVFENSFAHFNRKQGEAA
jgi:hypothetical protein